MEWVPPLSRLSEYVVDCCRRAAEGQELGRLQTKQIPEGSSCTPVLVGWDTRGRKYVDWEIDATLQKKHGLIGMHLPTAPVAWNGLVEMPADYGQLRVWVALWIIWEQRYAGPPVIRCRKAFVAKCLSANTISEHSLKHLSM
jgi:hypothetical protein